MAVKWVDARKKLPPLLDEVCNTSDHVLIKSPSNVQYIAYLQYDWGNDPPWWVLQGRDGYHADFDVEWWAPLPPGPPIAEGYTIEIGHLPDQPNYGWFENDGDVDEYGRDDYNGGGLWFEGDTLVDYDGVLALPPEVVAALRRAGYTVDDGCLLDDEDVQKARDLQ